jgi:TetR/AcrR family transcriptional repressor of mexJK operon
VYAGSAGEMLQRVTAFLRKAMQAGALRRDDPEFAAELFLSMLAGQERVRRIYGIGNGAESEPHRVGRIVDCFLRAFAPERQ